MDAISWIVTVQKQPDGSTFLRLQYTRTADLNVFGIDWPHVPVATPVKQ